MASLRRRLGLFAVCVASSALPALLLTGLFAQPGDFLRVLRAFWSGVLLGPLAEWGLYGVSPGPVLVVAAIACPPLMLAHPVRPGPASAALTCAGFALWYGAAFVLIVNREAPV